MLKPIVCDGTPAATNLDILFHRNDPKDIYGDHGSPAIQSQRQPDIVITSLQSARCAGTPNKNASDTWNTISLKQATKKPNSRFQWYDVLASVEMESNCKEIPSTHVDNLGNAAVKLNRLPPRIVDMAPKPKKRSMRSESMSSVVEPAAKRSKTKSL